VVNGEVRAEGRDIYGQSLVVRSIWITQAKVQPGNSGGPMVDLSGNVLGVIFAASTSQSGQAYALTDAEVQPDIDQAQGRTQPVAVAPCAMSRRRRSLVLRRPICGTGSMAEDESVVTRAWRA